MILVKGMWGTIAKMVYEIIDCFWEMIERKIPNREKLSL